VAKAKKKKKKQQPRSKKPSKPTRAPEKKPAKKASRPTAVATMADPAATAAWCDLIRESLPGDSGDHSLDPDDREPIDLIADSAERARVYSLTCPTRGDDGTLTPPAFRPSDALLQASVTPGDVRALEGYLDGARRERERAYFHYAERPILTRLGDLVGDFTFAAQASPDGAALLKDTDTPPPRRCHGPCRPNSPRRVACAPPAEEERALGEWALAVYNHAEGPDSSYTLQHEEAMVLRGRLPVRASVDRADALRAFLGITKSDLVPSFLGAADRSTDCKGPCAIALRHCFIRWLAWGMPGKPRRALARPWAHRPPIRSRTS
jgi:hypothetical protein